MKRGGRFLCAALLLLLPAGARGAPADDSEIAALRQRVQDLERQNGAILKALEELRARLDRTGPPASRDAAEAPRPAVTAEQIVTWPEITSAQSRMKFYGFLRLDLITDDSRPDNPQSIFYILPEGGLAGPRDYSNFTLSPRLTRFGATFSGPAVTALGSAKISGLLEMDFNNGGRESRPIPRMRHAWFKLSRGDFFLLGGQTWDLVSPLMPTPNSDTVMWNVGNLGDRRAQIQAVYEPAAGAGRWYLGTALGLTGAVDGRDLDGDGFRDGEQSGGPGIQARVGYSWRRRPNGAAASVGLSAHRAWESTIRPIGGRSQFHAQSLGLDYVLPLHELLNFRGELWFGSNLSDVRGGIGQGIHPVTGAAIRSRGGWAELNVNAHSRWTVTPGFTIDDPRDEDIPAGGRVRNRSFYLANRFNLGGGMLVGADYLRWITDYRALPRGTDNRVNLIFQYSY